MQEYEIPAIRRDLQALVKETVIEERVVQFVGAGPGAAWVSWENS